MTAGIAEERGVHPNSGFHTIQKANSKPITEDPYCKPRSQEGLVSLARTVPLQVTRQGRSREGKESCAPMILYRRSGKQQLNVEHSRWGENPRRFENAGKDLAPRWSGSNDNQMLGGYHTHKIFNLHFRQRQLLPWKIGTGALPDMAGRSPL